MICHPSNSISKSKLVSPRERNNELSHLLRPFPRAVCEHVPSKWKRSCLCGFGGAQEVPAGTGSEAPTPLGTPPCKTQGKVGSPPLLSLIPTSSASAGSVHSSFAPYLESLPPLPLHLLSRPNHHRQTTPRWRQWSHNSSIHPTVCFPAAK